MKNGNRSSFGDYLPEDCKIREVEDSNKYHEICKNCRHYTECADEFASSMAGAFDDLILREKIPVNEKVKEVLKDTIDLIVDKKGKI